jgi:hypothetical protein
VTADPHWVKGTLMEDYSKAVRSHGAEVDSRALERIVNQDLAQADAVLREAKPAPVKDEAPAAHERFRSDDRAADMAQETGAKFWRRPIPAQEAPKKDRLLDTPLRRMDAKWQAAWNRLGQLVKPKSMFRPSREIDYEGGDLARDFILTFQDYQRGKGEYAGLRLDDQQRVLRRKIEDICDRSTGRFGPWWVK